MGTFIREEEEYDRIPHRDDMTYTETQICDNITNCGNEIDMIDGTVRLLVQEMLKHWGLRSDKSDIEIRIKVGNVEETITWIDQPREKINFSHIQDHVLGLNAAIGANTNAPHWINFARGGDMGGRFDLTLTERNYDE
jgi:hypothetical protein